jgi:hypothetical protein
MNCFDDMEFDSKNKSPLPEFFTSGIPHLKIEKY